MSKLDTLHYPQDSSISSALPISHFQTKSSEKMKIDVRIFTEISKLNNTLLLIFTIPYCIVYCSLMNSFRTGLPTLLHNFCNNKSIKMSDDDNQERFQPRPLKAESAYEYYKIKDTRIREYVIALESMHLLRDDLSECVRKNSVNQFTKCRELREQYFELCLDRYRGMIFPEGKEPTNRNVPGIVAPKIRSNF